MKKVLFVATVVQKHIMVFHLPFLKMFKEKGYQTYVAAANDTDSPEVNIPYCDQYIEIDFKRTPLHPSNVSAYRRLKKLVFDNAFDIIHCHTPVGGLLTRLAARKSRKKGTKVFYTAHGFHFYKGAPLKNWLLYYPVEKFCSRLTDVLITINQEDYALAQKKMRAKRVAYIPGVGIDLSRFENISVDRVAKRREIGVPEDAFLLISVGELSRRKNHIAILQALSKIGNQKIYYIVVGRGMLSQELKDYVDTHHLSHCVHFLGYRHDVRELYQISDVCCFPSIHEGLPVALMEAMASGVPVICSRIRGNVDLIDQDAGLMADYDDVESFAKAIMQMCENPNLREMCRMKSLEKIEQFSLDIVLEQMKKIYEDLP